MNEAFALVPRSNSDNFGVGRDFLFTYTVITGVAVSFLKEGIFYLDLQRYILSDQGIARTYAG